MLPPILPPDLVAQLDACAKSNFIGARDTWLVWQSRSSWAVIAGLVLEGPELVYEMLALVRKIQRLRYSIILRENRVELAKVAAFVGWFFIVGGLFGELKSGSRIADSNASIQVCSDAKVRAATLEAGSATDSASTAQSKLAEVETLFNALDKRMKEASGELAETEQRVIAQGPRDKLLRNAAPRLIKALSQFAGQRVKFFVCGEQGDPNQEMIDTWGAISDILVSEKGAGWKVAPPNLGFAGSCGAAQGLGQGFLVFVSGNAPEQTKSAAAGLWKELGKVIPLNPAYKLPIVLNDDFVKSTVGNGFTFERADRPWNIPAFDTGLITVLVENHP